MKAFSLIAGLLLMALAVACFIQWPVQMLNLGAIALGIAGICLPLGYLFYAGIVR